MRLRSQLEYDDESGMAPALWDPAHAAKRQARPQKNE